jgi:leucyl-tRNA synthetase
MMDYNFREIEKKWQAYWRENQSYRVEEDLSREKFYVLDMFPYPSGAGLHVGHPLGYIASDIFSRYKRLKGFNVLHPMGYDSFGLPAEQYAIQTGQHPAITTENNIARYREQLDKIGFSFDWSREVRTSDPSYYKWTQWIFKQLFNSWYNKENDKAESIDDLIKIFEEKGNAEVQASGTFETTFSAEDWNAYNAIEKENILQEYRLSYLSDTMVNWCEELGTVLANDEVKDGLSERGGYPVVQKKMRQWSMRISAYAERLLQGLDKIDFSDSLKEQQRNWIGRSVGASVHFAIDGFEDKIEVFTTRPDTIFGASFMTLAPEHELVAKITTAEQKAAVEAYQTKAAAKTERDRMSNVKEISGEFTGAYALHPFSGEKMPIWIGDYVLASYGTGAVMAVPAGDQRDYDFASHFGISIPEIFEGHDLAEGAYVEKDAILMHSEFLNGLSVPEATKMVITKLEEKGIGKGKVNYRLRDAIFSRQRYWGEPFPVYFENELPQLIEDEELPLTLPPVDKYLPTESGEPPLARARKEDWQIFRGDRMETNTMPGWAGSAWYFLRYMDPKNEQEFVSREKADYWKQVDLYIGGSEHAVGHLLYSRFWTKFLFDRGYIGFDEPFKKLINQGMILGRSSFVYRDKNSGVFISKGLCKGKEVTPIHVDISMVENDVLNIRAFQDWRPEFKDAAFELEDGKYICGSEVEKMSKSKFNVQTPDELVDKFGADTLRCYEMFLGPLEQAKPWDTQGINGVHNFLRRFWNLSHRDGKLSLSDEAPSKEALKSLHKTIQKVEDDINRFSFNTPVSALMICVNELTEQKCNNRSIIKELTIVLSSYAPHIAEELWQELGHTESINSATYPTFNPAYLIEDSYHYPVSFNGKMRFQLEVPRETSKEEVEKLALADERAQKWLEGVSIRKVIVVPGKIVNVVVG